MDVNNNARKNRDANLPERRKVEPVLDRVPDVLEPSKTKKFFDSFIASDMESVKDYVVMKVLLPRVQSMVLDMIRNGAEMLIMGPGAVSRNGSYNNRSAYNRASDSSHWRRESLPSRPSTTYVPYSDPILETEFEALDVIDKMIEYVEEYPVLSISDYLGFCNRPKDDEYTYQNYGWSRETVMNCRPEQIPDGRFVIKLPRPRYIR